MESFSIQEKEEGGGAVKRQRKQLGMKVKDKQFFEGLMSSCNKYRTLKSSSPKLYQSRLNHTAILVNQHTTHLWDTSLAINKLLLRSKCHTGTEA